eukprot:5187191-Amphidinium_carterae.1
MLTRHAAGGGDIDPGDLVSQMVCCPLDINTITGIPGHNWVGSQSARTPVSPRPHAGRIQVCRKTLVCWRQARRAMAHQTTSRLHWTRLSYGPIRHGTC